MKEYVVLRGQLHSDGLGILVITLHQHLDVKHLVRPTTLILHQYNLHWQIHLNRNVMILLLTWVQLINFLGVDKS
jgi:hypothetical protein